MGSKALTAACICLAFAIGTKSRDTIECDLIELNHVYDLEGNHQFSQVIAWDWCDNCATFHAAGWQMLENGRTGPKRIFHKNKWRFAGRNGSAIEANGFRRTWTQFDPEMIDRQTFPEQLRRLRDWAN